MCSSLEKAEAPAYVVQIERLNAGLGRIFGHQKLDDVLKHNKNNYDLLRLILSLMVIYGHTPAFYENIHWFDPVSWLLKFGYSGSIAVIIFFLLSGLFVTESLTKSNSLFEFSIRRILRVYPALMFCLVISIVILGPIFTDLRLKDYFFNSETWTYFSKKCPPHEHAMEIAWGIRAE